MIEYITVYPTYIRFIGEHRTKGFVFSQKRLRYVLEYSNQDIIHLSVHKDILTKVVKAIYRTDYRVTNKHNIDDNLISLKIQKMFSWGV